MTWDPKSLVGEVLGDYLLDEFRGSGAFGAVYECTNIATGERVALKVLRPGANIQSHHEFANEGALLAKMAKASKVLDIFDSRTGTVNVTLSGGASMAVPLNFHVLEIADDPLSVVIARLDEVSWATRLGLFRDVVLGIHQMHTRGIVHRDIKSDNVLLFRSGNLVVAKLNDLGRARDLGAPASPGINYEFTRGDPAFAPPELLWGAGTDSPAMHTACDLYGLGSLFIELAIGQGITGLAVYPHAATLNHYASQDSATRLKEYQNRLAEIRSWYEAPLALVSPELPSCIKMQGDSLARQLCDPDPLARYPRISVGRRGPRANHLQWMLNRIDSMQLTLRNSDAQAARLRSRKTLAK